jgi:uncharacterized protein YidB (DUF937 family)
MGNPLLGQVLGAVFANAARRRGIPGGFGGLGGMQGGGLGGMRGGGLGGLGGVAMGGVLGGMLGGRRGLGGGRSAMLALLLPLAMQWVQRNGGLGAVLQRAQQRGLGRHANSWVSTGDNHPIAPDEVQQLVDDDEVARMAQQSGLAPDEVRDGFAQILPEMVNQLTPDGELRAEADGVLDDSIPLLEDELQRAQREPAT